jgi:hypothetical protein
MSEIIKVAFVNQPKTPQAKSGSIKTEDGRYLGVFANKLSQFAVGGSYEIETKAREYNGKTYHDITSAKPVSAPSGNGNGAHATGNLGGIEWGNAKNVAAQLVANGVTPENFDSFLKLARMVYAATPTEVTVESATDGQPW